MTIIGQGRRKKSLRKVGMSVYDFIYKFLSAKLLQIKKTAIGLLLVYLKVDILHVRPKPLFSIGELYSFLASLGRNRVYSAHKPV